MSILDVISHRVREHSFRAQSEGRHNEVRFFALLEELMMAAWSDVQGKLNSLSDKVAQLEADVPDLLKKVGSGSAAAPPPGNVVPQGELDAAAAQIDNLSTRVDALVQSVVKGPEAPAAPPADPAVPAS